MLCHRLPVTIGSRRQKGASIATIVGAVLMCGSGVADADFGWITTKVLYAGTYGGGDVYVVFTDTLNEPGCPAPRLDVASGTEARNVLSSAYVALASGLTVRVSSSGCFNGYPTLDNARASGFQVLAP